MVRRLIMDVISDTIQMRMRHGKRAKALLPGKPAADPLLLVDMIRRSGFDVTDQIRGSDAGFQTEQAWAFRVTIPVMYFCNASRRSDEITQARPETAKTTCR